MLTHRIIKVIQPTGILSRWVPPGTARPTLTQEGLDRHITKTALKVGDFVAFLKVEEDAIVQSERCMVIVRIEDDIAKVYFDAWGKPRPYQIMGLNGTSEMQRKPDCNFKGTPYVRYDSGESLYLLPDNQRQKVNDDFVQNYIKEHLPHVDSYCSDR